MRSPVVVVIEILSNDTPEMAPDQSDDMIEAVTCGWRDRSMRKFGTVNLTAKLLKPPGLVGK